MATFHLDHDVSIHLAPLLRRYGHPANTAHDLGMEQAHDGLQLLASTRRGAVLVSHNLGDFKVLHQAWGAWSDAWGVSQPHGGILVLPHGVAAEHLQRLLAFLQLGWPAANALHFWRGGRWRPFP